MIPLRLSFLLASLACAPLAWASSTFEFWPGATYDPSIPTQEAVLGHQPGEDITSPEDVRRYFDALAAAAPDRLRVVPYGRSWQGRELAYVIVTSPGNMARLTEIQAGMRELADPRRTGPARAGELLEGLPATTWLAYGVHGNELSSSDAAMLTAYHLLAATNDPRTASILADSVVYLDPDQNPDGRARFINHFTNTRGLQPAVSPVAAERIEPWPGGRSNHYLFDMNRDWYALTQPETRGRVTALRELLPLVFVDLHEMGGDSTYYFAPEAVPYNPHLVASQREALELFGRNNARWFDRFGIDYFTREVFDAFFPGYGASWPAYYGAVAMTYEQARVRGLAYRRYDGSLLHYRESVRNHFVTSLSTAEAAAGARKRLLTDFYAYRASAVEEGRREKVKGYAIPTQPDQSAADKLAGLLAMQGVEVGRATRPVNACGRDYAPGSYFISKAQPAKRLLRVLLDRQVEMPEDFTREQERRRAKDLDHEIYDVTAWSLPLMFNVAVDECGSTLPGGLQAVAPGEAPPGRLDLAGAPAVAFLVPWGSAGAAKLAGTALRAGLRVKSSDEAFTLAGRNWPAGTLIFDVADNPSDLAARLADLVRDTGVVVSSVDDSYVTAGPSLGSGKVVTLPVPEVALAWDAPVSTLSAGHTRYVIEQQFGYPLTPVRVSSLARADLREFDVIILPDESDPGSYASVLGESGLANLGSWIESGGTLIAIGDAVRALSKAGLSAVKVEDAWVEEAEASGGGPSADPAEDKEPAPATVPGTRLASAEDYRAAIRPERESPDGVPGAIARVEADSDHWLAAGIPNELFAVVSGSLIVAPLPLDAGANVVRFAGADSLLASGYLWEESRLQLAYKPLTTVERKGRGLIINFTQEPAFRAQQDGLAVLLMNAVLRSPAKVRRGLGH